MNRQDTKNAEKNLYSQETLWVVAFRFLGGLGVLAVT